MCNFIPNSERRAYIRKKRLYDWAKKYAALRRACPELRFRHVKMIKGGWNIGFIVDKKYVFKIRKFFDDEVNPVDKVVREKRITDAFQHISPLKIPKIDIVESDGYTFYRYNFIHGRNMNTYSLRTIRKYESRWGKQIAQFIYAVHNSKPVGIDDTRELDGDGWNHNDICNNLIINPKTMKIIGLIDWEYAGWGMLETEIRNCIIFSRKIVQTHMEKIIRDEYKKLSATKH